MTIKFDKMHAIGNDFVMIDQNCLPSKPSDIQSSFFQHISNRIHGVGCDLVVIYSCENNVVSTSFFNRDGSEAEICGNGARCIGLLMNKRYGICNCVLRTKFRDYTIRIGDTIDVDMGIPSFNDEDIGLLGSIEPLQSEFFPNMFCVSIGNPHLVIFPSRCLSEDDIQLIGAKLESHPLFKNRINVSFAYIVSANEIDLSVFERGVGRTLACGSGACATAFVAYHNGLIKRNAICVRQKGGNLNITIDDKNHVWQSGSATYVFRGEI